MNTKKIIAGITIIGMIWAVPAASLAGDRYDRSDRGHSRVERNHGNRGDRHIRGENMHERDRRHWDRKDYHKGSHHHYQEYHDRGRAHRNHVRNEIRVTHPRVRVVVTPLGIFPVFY